MQRKSGGGAESPDNAGRGAGGVRAKMIAADPIVSGSNGPGTKFPPQFGHTYSRMFSTQERQKVHSKVQIIAFVESGGSAVLQFSRVGLSSSMKGGRCDFSLVPGRGLGPPPRNSPLDCDKD